MRPIGAMIFGHYGDRMSRKAVLIITIALLSVATVLIGCLPAYSTLGVFAAVLLTLCRLAQGSAIGGEPGYCVYLVAGAKLPAIASFKSIKSPSMKQKFIF